jgi:hypothetical protein
MKNLQINENNALKLYPSASVEFKQMLTDTFGEKFFQQKITDRIKSYGDACEVLGVSSEIIGYDEMSRDEQAYRKLKIIIEALNEGWKPNWNDTDEPKYYPWFYMKGSFRLFYVYAYYFRSLVGSRLCFQKKEVAEYAVSQFLDLYKKFFTA